MNNSFKTAQELFDCRFIYFIFWQFKIFLKFLLLFYFIFSRLISINSSLLRQFIESLSLFLSLSLSVYWRQKKKNRLGAKMIQENSIWIFGYGSLTWKPSIKFSNKEVGFIWGFSRKFWQGNIHQRGTLEKVGTSVCLSVCRCHFSFFSNWDRDFK